MEGTPAVYFCRPLSLSLPLPPLAIFDQYYKNQPTDFLRKILPPCPPEYFIAVHPSSDPSFLLLPRIHGEGEDKKRRKEIGRGSGTRFGFASSRAPSRLSPGISSFRTPWVGKQHCCGQYEIFLRFHVHIFFSFLFLSFRSKLPFGFLPD